MIKRKIGKNIQDARIQSGLSQREVARRMNVSNSTVASWEIDRTEPSEETLEALANMFQTTSDKLLDEQPSTVEGFLRANSDFPDKVIEIVKMVKDMDEKKLDSIINFVKFTEGQ